MSFLRVLSVTFLALTGCGYHFGYQGLLTDYRTITVPYIVGDQDGIFTSALVHRIGTSSPFRYCKEGGDLLLCVKISEVHNKNIGFRYERKKKGKLRDILIPTETRIIVYAEVSAYAYEGGPALLEPVTLEASVDYDHDYYSSRDAINVFSLGQYTDIDEARDAVKRPLSQELAKKIVEYISQVW